MRSQRRGMILLGVLGVVGTIGCSGPDDSSLGEDAVAGGVEETGARDAERTPPLGAVVQADSGLRAEMVDTDGVSVGTVLFSSDTSQGGGFVQIHLSLHLPDLIPGPKGFHVHEGDRCAAPGFETAGDHFDPLGAPHGAPDDPPDSRHAGDLGNVPLDEEGYVEYSLEGAGITLREGATAILGRVVILHEGEDDLSNQPGGDAGDPVACGVIEENR